MDYARKIGKKEGEFWSKHQSVDQIPLKPSSIPETIHEEDHRLINWKRWLTDRQRRQEYLAGALKREPRELILNAHERTRTKTETRYLLESAGKMEITNQDRYRGNPAFWKTPERLINTVVEDDEKEDDVVVTMDRNARNLPPELTRVALSNFIRKEKMLLDSCMEESNVNLNTKWECGDYLRTRTTELRKEILFLEPKKPEMEDLIVIGKNFQCGDKPQIVRTPVITISSDETKKNLLNDPNERIALKIQDREFVLEKGHHFEKLSPTETKRLRDSKEDLDKRKYAYSAYGSGSVYRIFPKKVKPITWTLIFETHENEICERKLKLENKGVQVVHMDWRNVTPSFLPFPIPEHFDSPFFFNKDCISILPGQKVEVPIWFNKKRPGVATETWKLLTEPKIYPSILRLRFWGISYGKNLKHYEDSERKAIKNHIKIKVRNTKIREILEELFLDATSERYIDEIPYYMYFLEREIFQAKNPTYYYHSDLVGELKRMYKNVMAKNWNLSLKELRSILLKIVDTDTRRSMLMRFQEICTACLQSNSLSTHPVCSKKKVVYWLLCTRFNLFENESQNVMNSLYPKDESDDLDEGDEKEAIEIEETESEILTEKKNSLIYREVFYVRIYCLLCETIASVCNIIDTHNYFNKDEVK